MKRQTGRFVTVRHEDERYRAFVPHPLPPDPPLRLSGAGEALLQKATIALGRLDAVTSLLPEPALFVYAYLRKEALLSSQIEGTQSSYEDLLRLESDAAPGVPLDDVREVSDCVAALDDGLRQVRRGRAVSTALLCRSHAILLRGGRGREKTPGKIRRGAVWIGGPDPTRATFVPPPASRLAGCLDALDRFLRGRTPTLIKAALAHVQLETIHPFRDGNGRIGRLLVTLLLCAEGALSEPTLNLSLHFKSRRREYYDRLQAVREEGDWEGWLRFFLAGVHAASEDGLRTTKRLLALFENDRRKIERLGRAASTGFRLHELLQRKPILAIGAARDALGLSYPTLSAALDRMRSLGVVRELTGFRRNRLFAYRAYIDILAEGTEPLRS